MGKEFSITPRVVPHVETKFRRIVTPLPHPDSVADAGEAAPVRAEIDARPAAAGLGHAPRTFSFSINTATAGWTGAAACSSPTAGHGAPSVRQAIIDQVNSGLLHNYVFPSEERAELVELLVSLAPARAWTKSSCSRPARKRPSAPSSSLAPTDIQKGGKKKIGIIGAERGFHGRTLGRAASRRHARAEDLDRE